MTKLEKIQKKLKQYNQEHLLNFIDSKIEKQEAYLTELEKIDYKLIQSAFLKLKEQSEDKLNCLVEPFHVYHPDKSNIDEYQKFYDLGFNELKNGKIAILILAGGLGTRLGHNGPKGTMEIGPFSQKSIFQLHIEKILALSNIINQKIQTFIMTGPENDFQTREFFKNKSFFGYDENYIHFFKQEMLPAIDINGKILLKDKMTINYSPNGNGGCFSALKNSGLIDLMEKQKIDWLFLCGVDNILVKIADPYFIGFTISQKKLVSSKVVSKKNPTEKVGVLCRKNGKPTFIEYSELTKEMQNQKNEKDELVYNNANILSHMLHIKFLNKITKKPLPLHLAFKKLEHINEKGEKITPTEPNGYNLEYFLFDSFEYINDMGAIKVSRCEEFAPIKNPSGEDSPETAKKSILHLHRNWLMNNNIRTKDLEISAYISLDGQKIDRSQYEKILIENKKWKN